MSAQEYKFTTPVGRVVSGSVWDPKTTDYDGNRLLFKSGPLVGQPGRKEYGFGVAFPKTQGATHWAQEGWLKPFWDLGHASFPNGEAQRTDFAWKITDGDSQIPRKGKNGQPGRKPCEQEGYPGHWVVWFSGATAPRTFNSNGTQAIDPSTVRTGFYVQVQGNAKKNTGASPGLFVNHGLVALAGHGAEIVGGPDPLSAGFGNAPLPPGASAVPVGGMAVPGAAPLPPGSASAPVPVPGAAYAPAAAVTPPPAMPAAPTAGRVMLPAAGGATYEQMVAAGWTDATLVQHGMMSAPAAAPVPAPLPPGGSAPTAVPPVPGAVAPGQNVAPNPAFPAVPGAPPAAPVPPPPAAPARVMLPAAGGATYEQMISAGWIDATLVQHGMMSA
jgi:hypothetical protein